MFESEAELASAEREPSVEESTNATEVQDAPVDSKSELVDQIMTLDPSFSGDEDRDALLEMDIESLQVKADDEQREAYVTKIISENPTLNQADPEAINAVREAYKDIPLSQLEVIANQRDKIIDQIIEGDKQLNGSTEEFSEEYRERLKNMPLSNEQLQEMVSGQQDRLGADGTGIGRKNLPQESSYVETSNYLENHQDAVQFKERWFGKDNDGSTGVAREGVKASYLLQFRKEATEEVQEQVSKEVQGEVLQQLLAENQPDQVGDDNKTAFLDIEGYLQQNEADIKQKIAARMESKQQEIDAIVEQKVSEKTEKAINLIKSNDWEGFVDVLVGNDAENQIAMPGKIISIAELQQKAEAARTQPTQEPTAETGDDEDAARAKQIEELKKDPFKNLKEIGGLLAEFISDTAKESRFEDLVDAFFVDYSGRFHRSSLGSYKEQNGGVEVGMPGFTSLIEKYKTMHGVSTFRAYDSFFRDLTIAFDMSDESLRKELPEGDQAGLQKKAEKMYQLLSKMVQDNDIGKINDAFRHVYKEKNLEGEFGAGNILHPDIIDHFYLLVKDQHYNKYVGSPESASSDAKSNNEDAGDDQSTTNQPFAA